MIRTGPPLAMLIAVLMTLLAMPANARAATAPPDSRLCTQCHTRRSTLISHVNVPGDTSDCLQCHVPHSIRGSPGLYTPPSGQCTACHTQYASKTLNLKKDQEGYRIHSPVRSQKCEECHLPHELGAQASYKGGSKNASCAGCHAKTMQQKDSGYQHTPFRDNFCSDCHDPHGSPQPAYLRIGLQQLCTSCHADTAAQQSLPNQHPPFEKGFCTDCHSPHAGVAQGNLRAKPEDLCTNCHSPKDRDKAFQHQPYKEGSCTQCHSPHASNGDHLIKADSQQQLCGSCHTDVADELGLPSRHPVGQQLVCTSCHKPHGSDFPALLQAQGRALCATCHPSQAQNFDRIGHGTMAPIGAGGQCTACHRPHGSAEKPLLKAASVSLCRTCHQPQSAHEHPMGNAALAPITGLPVVCSSCHNPHGTPFDHAVRRPGDALCLTCHDK